jgi:protein-L-isoaspartate(D-aspartate) O-methyltransferase
MGHAMKPLTDEQLAVLRRHMVELIEIEYALTGDETGRMRPGELLRHVLLALPRHRFVPPALVPMAYQNRPLPIGFDKTISQPFLSALMVDLLDLKATDRILEVGTGLGYQTALLAALGQHVWTVDVVEEFVFLAREHWRAQAIHNITSRIGDGSTGWPNVVPFDAIMVSAAVEQVPLALVQQLAIGGRMVLPLGGTAEQALTRYERRSATELTYSTLFPVRFTALET